ncbi:hypothetical protein C8Q74DRAFT_1279301 [Fomes fomentarius]|nr:hypothetical protein C8Q74DRAFT_1279301 [Fomes fomentarius]
MDLYDDPGNPEVTAMLEVPGMKADQLSLRIENGRLIVEGERVCPRLHTSNSDTRDANSAPEPRADATAESAPATLYPTRELKYGKFRREINLPPGVNATHVRSMLAEGMLTITWPRNPAATGGSAATDLPGHPYSSVSA